MEEIWKEIKGYEGLYEVSSYGRIKRLEREYWHTHNKTNNKIKEIILKLDSINKKYEQIQLTKNNTIKKFLVHRLVAIAFIPNKHNKLQVNHIDENKLNNNVNNLEWCTQSENINHGNRNKIVADKISKQIKSIDKNGNEKFYKSALDAEKYGYSRFCISMCCNKKILSHKGLKWEFTNNIKI